MKAKLATCLTLAATMFVATSASADKLPDPVTVEIASPADGTMIEGAPATIDVVVTVFGSPDNIELFVDDVSVAQIAPADPFTFTGVELAEGMHTLRAAGNLAGIGYNSPDIDVAVVAGGETGEEGTGTAGGSGDEAGNSTTSDGGTESTPSTGSACSTTRTNNDTGLLGLGLLGLAVLGLTRRRA
jgi:MYXO-CTERM domain-containing protein